MKIRSSVFLAMIFIGAAPLLGAAPSDAWLPTALTVPVQDVAIAPSDSRVMVAVGYGSLDLFRTVDRGASWTAMAFPRSEILEGGETGLVLVRGVAIDPRDAAVIEVAAIIEPPATPQIRPDLGAVYRTRDGGATWEIAGNTIFPHLIEQVIFAPGDPSFLYAAGAERGTFGVYRSRDLGDSWEAVTGGLPSDVWSVGLAADPSAPGRLFAAIYGLVGQGLYRTDDSGATWSGPLFGYGAVSVSADSSVYARTDGVWKSTDAGATWRRADHGLPPDVDNAIPDPRNPNRLFIGSLRNGVFSSVDAGESWRPFPSTGLPPPHIGGLSGLVSPGYSLAIAPDGSYLAAPSWSGLLIHPLPPPRRIAPVAPESAPVVTRPR
ncbi:MAG TPA: hypothetical protein VFS34_01310 [Thermoanaerobaculia bacterium]|nr:hypothetical protein [Thermoanaerobaculia bacterium]